jgi:hypothetical protein
MNRDNIEFPYSIKFCINCNKERKFKYDRIIGHSACMTCLQFGETNKTFKYQKINRGKRL